MPDAPTAASLFSGAGLLDLGLEWAGWNVRWGCEIDPWCRDLWRQRFERPCYGDAGELPADVERVTLLAGGFPCQPSSLAGKGLAQEDPRWLWPLFERAIRRLRPRYVFVENVLGLVNRGMADVLRDLAALGFDAQWTVFGAYHVGAPHLRRRLWLVAAHPDEVELWDESGGLFGSGWSDACLGPPRALADSDESRRARWTGDIGPSGRDEPPDGGGPLADAAQQRCGEGPEHEVLRATVGADPAGGGSWWSPEPDVDRVAYGVPDRLERLAALGNGVVPQCAELVGRRLMSFHRSADP